MRPSKRALLVSALALLGASSCEGPAGPVGAAGTAISIDPDVGESCSHGGIRVRVGKDTDQDGVLQDREVTATEVVCNATGEAAAAALLADEPSRAAIVAEIAADDELAGDVATALLANEQQRQALVGALAADSDLRSQLASLLVAEHGEELRGPAGEAGPPGRTPLTAGTDGLGLELVGGVLAVTCNDAPCSEENHGWVVMPRRDGGDQVGYIQLAVRRDDHTFHGGGSETPDIGPGPFGTTAGVPHTAGRPMFIYAVNTDNTDDGVLFMLSSAPNMQTLTSEFACTRSTVCPVSGSVAPRFLLVEGAFPGGAEGAPVQLIGAVVALKNSLDLWTPVLYRSSLIGPYQKQFYDVPRGLDPDNPAGYFQSADAPRFPDNATDARFRYAVGSDGFIDVEFRFQTPDQAGTGAADLALPAPFPVGASGLTRGFGTGLLHRDDLPAAPLLVSRGPAGRDIVFYFADTGRTVRNEDIDDAVNGLQGSLRFRRW